MIRIRAAVFSELARSRERDEMIRRRSGGMQLTQRRVLGARALSSVNKREPPIGSASSQ